MIGILLFVVVIFFIGYMIHLLLFPENKNILSRIGLAWGIGIGAIAFQMSFYSALRIEWSIISLLIPWILFIFLTFFLRTKAFVVKNISFPITFSFKFLLFLIFVLFSIVVIESLLHPVNSWDAVASWFLGGKAFYIDGFVNPSFIQFANNSIPPVLNLIIAFSYIVMGSVNDTYSLLLYPFFFLFSLIVFYSFIKMQLDRLPALFFTFLFAATPNILRHAGRYDAGYADFPLSYFFLSSVFVLFSFIKTRSTKSFVLLNILLSTGALVKSEGVPFFILVQFVALFYIITWKEYKKALIIFIGLLPLISWQIFKISYSLPGNPFIVSEPNIYRLPAVILEVGREFVTVGRWNLLWIAFLISSAYFLSKKKKERWETILFSICIGQLFVYLTVYLMTSREPIGHIRNSFDRLLLHIAPLAMAFIAFVHADFFRKLFIKNTFVKIITR